jgi:hypothetical protein
MVFGRDHQVDSSASGGMTLYVRYLSVQSTQVGLFELKIISFCCRPVELTRRCDDFVEREVDALEF